MKSYIKRIVTTGLLVGVLSVGIGNAATAHVVVRPTEVVTAGFQTFTVGVPNEKDIPTIGIKVEIPAGMQHVSPTAKLGWDIEIETDGNGESATVKSLTWTGGTVNKGFRDDFAFSAKVPEVASELKWKAYQTYADGSVVAWDKETTGEGHESEDKSSGPLSVTKVVAETEDTMNLKKAEQTSADAKTTAERALYVGLAGIVVGLAGIFAATRKR